MLQIIGLPTKTVVANQLSVPLCILYFISWCIAYLI